MDTSKPYSGTADSSAVLTTNLLPMLTIHSAQRDQSLGLPRPGRRTLSLVDYRRKRDRQATVQLASAAFLRGLIGECQAEVSRLIEEADTADKRREVLPEVERLQEIAEKAARELDKMTGSEDIQDG